MQSRHVVVLVIDRLGASWLGPYGNTWLETPHASRLAASALLCEAVVADSPDLVTAYAGYWTGRHALTPPARGATPLAQLAAAAGLHSLLLTDEEQVATHPLAASFAEIRHIETPPRSAAADSLAETGLFQLTATAIEALSDAARPSLVWIHARGLAGAWDAPLEYRNRLADLDDPEPPAIVDPPSRVLAENYDPDELLGLTQAYAGQVAAVDEGLGLLLDALDEQEWSGDALLIVTSPRGYPLGEHRRVGAADEALYAELLQVPLLVRFPQRAGALLRTQAIVQPAAVYDTIAGGALDLSRLIAGESIAPADTAVAIHGHERSIRTPAWFLRESPGGEPGDPPRRELFAKPDDRFEVNEVASRCGEECELLAARLDEFEAAARAGTLAELPPLAELLADVWR
jgi:hypothetical protein